MSLFLVHSLAENARFYKSFNNFNLIASEVSLKGLLFPSIQLKGLRFTTDSGHLFPRPLNVSLFLVCSLAENAVS